MAARDDMTSTKSSADTAGPEAATLAELARRTAMLDAVGFAATEIVAGRDWRATMPELLKRLGLATGVSRVSLFEVFEDADGRLVESCRHDWAEPGRATLSDDPRFQEIPLIDAEGRIDDWTARRQAGEIIDVKLSAMTGDYRNFFLEHGTQSFLSVPVMAAGRLWGFLGFDDCHVERDWQPAEIAVLRTAAALIAGAIEQAESTERLRLSEERYALAARGANDGLWDWDVAAGHVYYSPRLQEILGLAPGSMIGKIALLFEQFQPADAEAAEAELERCFAERREEFRFEARLRPMIGKPSWIVARGLVLFEGARAVRVVGALRDITGYKEAQTGIREGEARLRAILATALDAIVIADEAGRVFEFNDAACRIFGLARDQVIGRPIGEVIVPTHLREAHAAGMRRYLMTGQSRVIGKVVTLEGLHADGRLIPIELAITEVTLPAGRMFTAIIRDISERKRFEQQLTEAERQRASLARYFSPGAVEEIMRAGGRVDETRSLTATVLFADLVKFTAMSASMPGERVIRLLREFHALVEDAVFSNHGTLDKYLGDGLLATFGTPRPGLRDASNAIACARQMVRSLNRWNERRRAEGQPAFLIGIGLHRGEVTMGTVGSERRPEFTVVGDTVNLASRIEAASRALETAIVASDDVMAAARREGGEAVLAGFEDLGAHTLRGRRGTLRLWGLTSLAIGTG
jgi:PAS domain S-box-containing protein